MKITLKKTMALALCAMLLLLAAIPALNVHAEPATTKVLKVKKVLTKAEKGVTTPTEDFTFNATAHSFDNNEAKKDDCPDLTSGIAKYTEADDTDNDATKDGKQLFKQSDDMLSGVTFTKAGQYTYTVKETAGSTTGMTYSQAEYLVSLMVVKSGDNYVVDKILIKKTKNDDGTPTNNDTKTTYNPDEDNNGANNNLAFNNIYDKTGGNETPEPGTPEPGTPSDTDKQGFVVNKVVDSDTAAEFGFKLTLDAPKAATATALAVDPTAKIVKSDGNVKDVTLNAYGTPTEFKLKKGEKLVLTKVLLGSTAKVEETDAQGFTPSVSANGFDGTITSLDSLKNAGVVLSDKGGNYATVTNTQQSITGILIHNLPFILLFIVAVAGITVYIRNRNRAKSEF